MIEKCHKHPRYKGKRKPKNLCVECLRLYLKMTPATRLPVPPPSFKFKDKTKYTRKKKHKNLDS